MSTDPGTSDNSAGFWKRQFQLPPTPLQNVFDVCFGIIAPILCVIFDPAVFRSDGLFGASVLYDFRLYAYAEIGIGIAALAYFLLTRRASALLAGILYAGALFSGLLGLFILPLTLLGLLILIGIFGPAPFFSAFVMERNASRCWRESSTRTVRFKALRTAALAALLALGLPLAAQLAIFDIAGRAMAALQTGSEPKYSGAVRTLKLLKFGAKTDEIVFAYQKATDAKQRERLARAYQAITGRDIVDRLTELSD